MPSQQEMIDFLNANGYGVEVSGLNADHSDNVARITQDYHRAMADEREDFNKNVATLFNKAVTEGKLFDPIIYGNVRVHGDDYIHIQSEGGYTLCNKPISLYIKGVGIKATCETCVSREQDKALYTP